MVREVDMASRETHDGLRHLCWSVANSSRIHNERNNHRQHNVSLQEENEAKAFADAGLRGVVGHVCFSWRKKEDRNAIESLAKNWHDKADGLIRTNVDPHAPYTVDPGYMKELKAARNELNEKYGSEKAPIICHIHAAETSDEPEKVRQAFGPLNIERVMKTAEKAKRHLVDKLAANVK